MYQNLCTRAIISKTRREVYAPFSISSSFQQKNHFEEIKKGEFFDLMITFWLRRDLEIDIKNELLKRRNFLLMVGVFMTRDAKI